MFGDEALKEQIERMKKATFLNADPEEAIEKLQEINNNLEFFESGALKMLERELIKDVNGKNLWGEMKADFVRNKGINVLTSMKLSKPFKTLRGI